jgi:hypothetical protein
MLRPGVVELDGLGLPKIVESGIAGAKAEPGQAGRSTTQMEESDNTDRDSDQWKGRANVKPVVDLVGCCEEVVEVVVVAAEAEVEVEVEVKVDGSGVRPAEFAWDDEQRIAPVAISWVSE